jgi:ATP-dependent DNA helicase RecG
MRPPLLNPLFADVSGVKGIGTKTAKLLTKLLRPPSAATESARIVDVLLHMPTGAIDRRYKCKIVQLPQQGVVTVEVTVGRHKPPPTHNKKMPYRVEVHDETGTLSLVFFRVYPDQLRRLLPEGERRLVSGEIAWFGASPQISHPDHIVSAEDFEKLPAVEPVYPLTEGLSSKILAKAVTAGLTRLPDFMEWQDPAWLKRNSWPPFADALRSQHLPANPGVVDPFDASRLRLAYDELLANQLALALVRRSMKRAKGRALVGNGSLVASLVASLPFTLTLSQQSSIAEILQDMALPDRMIRLLQGDVGAGKTVVALAALATAVEAGTQGALMAPTELLARQHMSTLAKLGAAEKLRIGILTSREKGKQRAEILGDLQSGKTDIIIGTHALFQEGVTFHDLGLAVIDEQHRFGVNQRMALQDKANGPANLLVMTATPIPRTLALTAYGDMDVSKLTDKPPGRKPIETRAIPMSRIDDVIAGVGRSIKNGTRVYWVCPLIDESQHVELSAAEQRYDGLREIYGGAVGLVHGRLSPVDRDSVMEKFKDGLISVLVATTVIEVGVDVPEATIMVIENAERFGLAQLHQLRGRVGRGADKSSCILLYQEPAGEIARSRLQIMRETEDGFRIAEEDLRLRGAGEMLGTQQSGLPAFKIADLLHHAELLAAAKDDASLILSRDPQLASERGQALLTLLYLFERNEAVRLLASG